MVPKMAVYSLTDDYHSSLDIKRYVHFTSPIRRIIDTIIHWNICYDDKIVINLDRINFLDKQTKKFHRDMHMIEVINGLSDERSKQSLEPTSKPSGFDEQEKEGYVYEINHNKMIVYFHNIGFLKVKLWSDKFNFLEYKNEYKIGSKINCTINKIPGFLPKDRLLVKLIN
jgi:hypothetical protein